MSSDISVRADNQLTLSSLENVTQKLSKRAQKKLLSKEKWLKYKHIKRAKEKANLKERKRLARINNVRLGPSRKELKNHKMSLSNCKIRVALDFSFDNLMSERDLHKCINQFNHCYSINRRNSNPLQFYATSFNGRCKDFMTKNTGYTNWDVYFKEQDYLNIFKKEDIVYLTSESENIVHTLDETKVYIIGALVDHNSKKGLTLKIAQEQNIGHARLPINEFIDMKSRKVLSIDHVFEILANVACHGMSWKDAFLKVIPLRKGVAAKIEAEVTNSDENKSLENKN